MFRLFCLFALTILLNACALFDTTDQLSELPELAGKENWTERQKELIEITSWNIIGKIGVITADEAITAAINKWSQSDDTFIIDLSSTFFGLGASKLYGNNNFLTIVESGEDPISSYEPDKLIETALGFPLPLSHLPLWIKGIPSPDQVYQYQFDDKGLPSTLRQDGWLIKYSKYSLNAGIPLPGKIKLLRNDTRITLAIKHWNLQK